MRGRCLAVLLVLMLPTGWICCGAERGEKPGPGTGPLSRALRGARNIILSPLEVPATVVRVADERDAFFALWAGGLEGIGNGLVRLVAGVVELGTAPVPGNFLPVYDRRLGERAMPPDRPPTSMTQP